MMMMIKLDYYDNLSLSDTVLLLMPRQFCSSLVINLIFFNNLRSQRYYYQLSLSDGFEHVLMSKQSSGSLFLNLKQFELNLKSYILQLNITTMITMIYLCQTAWSKRSVAECPDNLVAH